MPIYVTPEEYQREKEHIDWLYYRIRLDNRNIKRWEYNLGVTRKWAERVKRYKDIYEEYAKPELERCQRMLNYWKEQLEIHVNTLKAERERFRQKVIKPKITYEYARITKDMRVYAREKHKAQTPDPVCEASASICIKLPHAMTNEEIEKYAEAEEYERKLEDEINLMLFAASFKAGRSHKKWVASVYKEQQFEAKGIDKDEAEYLGETRLWLKFYRPEKAYSHDEIKRWIRDVTSYYAGKPEVLEKLKQVSLEEYM